MNILLKNGRIWNGHAFTNGDVLVQNKTIAAIGQVPDSDVEITFDADGAIIAPGLVDIHTHLLRVSCDAYGTPADITCLPFGVTAAADASATYTEAAVLDTFRIKTRIFASCTLKDDHAEFDKTKSLLED